MLRSPPPSTSPLAPRRLHLSAYMLATGGSKYEGYGSTIPRPFHEGGEGVPQTEEPEALLNVAELVQGLHADEEHVTLAAIKSLAAVAEHGTVEQKSALNEDVLPLTLRFLHLDAGTPLVVATCNLIAHMTPLGNHSPGFVFRAPVKDEETDAAAEAIFDSGVMTALVELCATAPIDEKEALCAAMRTIFRALINPTLFHYLVPQFGTLFGVARRMLDVRAKVAIWSGARAMLPIMLGTEVSRSDLKAALHSLAPLKELALFSQNETMYYDLGDVIETIQQKLWDEDEDEETELPMPMKPAAKTPDPSVVAALAAQQQQQDEGGGAASSATADAAPILTEADATRGTKRERECGNE